MRDLLLDLWRVDEFRIIAFLVVSLVLLLGVIQVGHKFVHRPIEDGQYSGQAIEVEYETGFLMQTSTVYLKTDPTSSRFESLCIPDAPSNPLTDRLRDAATGKREVTAHYHTPLVVPPWDCSTTPILDDLEVHTDG